MFLQAHIFLQALSIVHSSYFRGTLTDAYYITGALIYICATFDVENYRHTCLLQAHMIVVLDLISRVTGALVFTGALDRICITFDVDNYRRTALTGAHDCSCIRFHIATYRRTCFYRRT